MPRKVSDWTTCYSALKRPCMPGLWLQLPNGEWTTSRPSIDSTHFESLYGKVGFATPLLLVFNRRCPAMLKEYTILAKRLGYRIQGDVVCGER